MKQSNLADIFKALSNPQRLALFELIYRGFKKQGKSGVAEEAEPCCRGVEKAFTFACGCLKLSRSTISHHLKELQNAGLIVCVRRGQSHYCEVNAKAVEAARSFLK
ncbi:MAG: helix-turn-helix transcriptional regulator [Nitrospinae bacterium]|nr:helix-turn-helix transcriptional regulator [Nitrospinota bacterium]